ncbi:MAG: ribosomal-protein-alanine N-acetyltransferase [SAR202 cluster bacterium]|nr:ribosomal-protein-alanine N-acetyltransferase [SAR202 cluster bacterium]|tara:strand:- start:695 stop:1327 length:633 start_codon:yes stop_codon:yes gene_type:complete
MELRDIPQVKSIDREAFPTVWPPPPLQRDITNRSASLLVAVIPNGNEILDSEIPKTLPRMQSKLESFIRRFLPSWIQERGAESLQPSEPVLGYVSIWAMGSDAHITAIAVDKKHQREGVGELLLIGTVISSLDRQLECVTLEVRESNEAAQHLYLKYGFEHVGVRKNYYRDNHEDAFVMTTKPIALPDYQRLFRQLTLAHKKRWGYSWNL